MQHPRIKLTTICVICTTTVAIHGWLYTSWTRHVGNIVREQVRSEIAPLREDIARAHMRLDQHLAVR